MFLNVDIFIFVLERSIYFMAYSTVGTNHTCLAVAKQRPGKQRLLGNNLVAMNRALANHGLATGQCLTTAMYTAVARQSLQQYQK
jgi:hypothetical protein